MIIISTMTFGLLAFRENAQFTSSPCMLTPHSLNPSATLFYPDIFAPQNDDASPPVTEQDSHSDNDNPENFIPFNPLAPVFVPYEFMPTASYPPPIPPKPPNNTFARNKFAIFIIKDGETCQL